MKYLRLALIVTSIGLLVACSHPERSRNLADPSLSPVTLAEQVCSLCHGLTGSSTSPIFPNLASQTPVYITAQLKGFKSHGRQDPAGFEYMWGLSRSLTDEQINGLATYYSKMPPERQTVEGDLVRVANGEKLFKDGMTDKGVIACHVCHGEAGQGNEQFPRIAGQHIDYLIKQLIVFQRTDERPEGSIMKVIAHELSKDDIENVATYLQALPNH